MFEPICTFAIPNSKAMVLHLGLRPDAVYAALSCDLDEWGVPYEAWPEKDRCKEWDGEGHYDQEDRATNASSKCRVTGSASLSHGLLV